MRRLPGLPALRIFEVVARTRSFTRAAERLNLTQSAVSKQIGNLERNLGEPLLIRGHHQLELTAAGRVLLEAARTLLSGLEYSLRAIGGEQNRLRINVPPTFARRWLLPRLGRLRARLPDIEVSLGTAIVDGLSEPGPLDCAIRFGDGEWPMLDARHLMTERHIAVAAPSLPGLQSIDSPARLSELPLLHVLAAADRRFLTWRHWLDAAGFPEVDLRHGLEFDQLDHAIEAARLGLGVTIADRAMIREELDSGTLNQLFDLEIEGHESYWFVTRPRADRADSIKNFRDWLFEEAARG